jgi:hypothetical protein
MMPNLIAASLLASLLKRQLWPLLFDSGVAKKSSAGLIFFHETFIIPDGHQSSIHPAQSDTKNSHAAPEPRAIQWLLRKTSLLRRPGEALFKLERAPYA